MKKVVILAVLALLTGCSTIPSEYTKGDGKSCIKTLAPMNEAWLFVSSVDDGSILTQNDPKAAWLISNEYNKPTEIWINPGSHKLTLMIVQKMGYGTDYISHQSIMLDVVKGMSYELKATRTSSINEQSEIFLNTVPTAEISKLGHNKNWVRVKVIPSK